MSLQKKDQTRWSLTGTTDPGSSPKTVVDRSPGGWSCQYGPEREVWRQRSRLLLTHPDQELARKVRF